MNGMEYEKLFIIRCKSKTGSSLSIEEQRYCNEMYKKYPEEYSAMDKEIFDSTKPFGAVR